MGRPWSIILLAAGILLLAPLVQSGKPGAKIRLDDGSAPLNPDLFIEPWTGRTRKDAAYPYEYCTSAGGHFLLTSDRPSQSSPC